MQGKLQVLFVTSDRSMDDAQYVVEALRLTEGVEVVVMNSLSRTSFRLQNPLITLPDVVVLDVYDFGWDGIPLIAELRKDARTKDLPIIALSTDCEERHACGGSRCHATRSLAAGASSYHDIPLPYEELMEDIRRLTTPA